jgi:hypothetical protein
MFALDGSGGRNGFLIRFKAPFLGNYRGAAVKGKRGFVRHLKDIL